MVSVSRFESFSRLPLAPTRTTSSCSDGSNSRSELPITRAFSQCGLGDVEHLSQGQTEPNPVPGGRLPSRRNAKQLTLDLSSQPSQEFLGTQDFATPVEQQFLVGYEASALNAMADDDNSRSPAPSPMRYQKRHRLVNLLDADSDCMSQDGVSQSKSQGEPSSCSKVTAAGPRSRPPIPRNKRKHDPVCTDRSPRVKVADDGDHAPSSLVQPLSSPKQHSRLYQDYIVEKEIGKGNFSFVYRAVHRQCGKAYAIKRSRRPLHSAADMQMWLEEVKALAIVEGHPNITTYHDSWSEPAVSGDYQHIKLELCGESLGSHVKAKQALSNQELWNISGQMASALKHIHDKGLVHLDLKPDNIYRAGPAVFKLGDFGLATLKDGSKGVSEGDARYLAPELLNSKNRHSSLDKADMFALGATLYELASGSPLPGTGERWHAVREGRLMMLPAVAHQLQTLIKKLMSADPAARPDAAAVLAICSKQMRVQTIPASSPR